MVVICVLSCCVSDYLLYYLCILIFFFYFSFCFFFILFIVILLFFFFFFFFSSRRRHTRSLCDWSSDVCSSDLVRRLEVVALRRPERVRPGEHQLLHPRQGRHEPLAGPGDVEDRPRLPADRSEERRVGKECRSRWSTYH